MKINTLFALFGLTAANQNIDYNINLRHIEEYHVSLDSAYCRAKCKRVFREENVAKSCAKTCDAKFV